MSQDLRNFLIGVAATFLVLILVSFFIFGGVFMYHLGKTNTTNEVVFVAEKAKDIAVNAQNTADKAITIASEANDNSEKAIAVATDAKQIANEAKTIATDAKSFTEKIATTKPEVKVVYVKPPVAPRDPQDQNEKLIGQIGNMVDSKLDAKLKPVYDKLENLSADQIEIKKQVKDLNTRFGYIETDVNKISGEQDRMKRMLMGEEQYKKMKEKELQEKKDCDDLSGNK